MIRVPASTLPPMRAVFASAGLFALLVSAPAKASEPVLRLRELDYGLFGGVLHFSPANNLRDEAYVRWEYAGINPELGLRASYLFKDWLGVEAELAAGATRTLDPKEQLGSFGAARVHALIPLPLEGAGFRPFVLAGAGFLGVMTNAMGNDVDPGLHAGVGTFYRLNSNLLLRADLRTTATQRANSDQGTAAFHPEFLLGVTYSPVPSQVEPPPPPPPVVDAPPPPPVVVQPPPPPPVVEAPPPPPPVVEPPPAPKALAAAFDAIEFESNKATLRAESSDALDAVASAMAQFPAVRVRITGHADNEGSPATNLKLSMQRAEAAKAYLVSRGIAASRLKAESKGATQPVADNATAEGRQKNRRVEFVVISQ